MENLEGEYPPHLDSGAVRVTTKKFAPPPDRPKFHLENVFAKIIKDAEKLLQSDVRQELVGIFL